MYLSDCPVRATINVVAGKWKPIVVNALKLKTLRFGELRRHVPEATKKVLREQLRELEQDQIIFQRDTGASGRAGGIQAYVVWSDSVTGVSADGEVGNKTQAEVRWFRSSWSLEKDCSS
jgi:HxlR-like helix-turn-helix protein